MKIPEIKAEILKRAVSECFAGTVQIPCDKQKPVQIYWPSTNPRDDQRVQT